MGRKERLNEAYQYLRGRGYVHTQVELAVKIGHNKSNLSSAFSGEDRYLTDGLLSKICANFPELNCEWLVDGKGEMLKSGSVVQSGSRNIQISGSHNKNIGTIRSGGNYEVSDEQTNGAGEATGVPYYDVDFIGGLDSLENDQTVSPTYYIHFPQYAKAESWVNVTGHSMEPLINHGDMVAMKRLEDWDTYLLYGEVYAIVTDEYRTIKYVRKSAKGDDYLRLIPANPDFDEQDIPKSVVRGVFQILGCAKRIF